MRYYHSKTGFLLIHFLVLLTSGFFSPGSGTISAQTKTMVHLVLERTAFLGGQTQRPRRFNVWLADEKMRMDDSRAAAVWRLDLGRIYLFSMRSSEYRDRPISEGFLFGQRLKDSTAYVWSVVARGVDSTQEKLPLKVYQLLGQSENSECEARIKAAPSLPSSLAKYCNAQFFPFWLSDEQWTISRKSDPLFASEVIVSIEWSTKNGEARDSFKLVDYEVVDLSVEQFEPPKGAVLLPAEKE